MTPQEFSAKIKSKNPSLQNVDDEALARKVIESNPNLKNLVEFPEKKYTPQPVAPVKGEKSIFEKLGGVADKASDLLFGSASKTIGTAIAAPILESQGKTKAAERLVKENITPGNIAFTALELYPGGGSLTKLLKKLPGGESVAKAITESVPEGLRAKAIKQYSEALGATTKELKAKTAKVVTPLLERGVTGNLQKLKSVAETELESAGKAVKAAEAKIPVFQKTAVKTIVEKAKNLRNSYIVNGKVIDDSAIKAIDGAISKISQFGDTIPDTSLVKIRRILDKSVALANKNFTKDEGLSLANEATQSMANTIRGILNTANPKLGAANKEFSLWSDVSKIVDSTLERRSTQGSGLTRFVGPLLGAGAGAAATGDILKGAISYFATDAAIKLFQSPLYKTISAVNKNKLADYIASGKIKEATLLTSKLLDAIRNENSK